MSDISKVDAKELLNIPEGPELIDVSDIQLDKTSVETYMNDFNKNFYKIKFSKKLLTDYYELYTLENYGINTKDVNDKDIRNETFVDEEEIVIAGIASNGFVFAKKITAELEKISGKRIAITNEKKATGDVLQTVADSSYLKQLTGFVPSISLTEGVSRFYDWANQKESTNSLKKWIG